jgi:arsenate reductase
MAVTIYHNPRCGTSRTVLAILREAGAEPQVIEYLVTPPDRAALKALLNRLGIGPRDILRRHGTPYDALGLDDPKWSDEALTGLIAEHPILMERPVVVTAKGAKLCRPAEVVRTLI